MNRSWEQFEGQIVNEEFRLQKYLGGSSQNAVFLTAYSTPASQKAVIKLVPSEQANADLKLSRWISAAALSHPHLLRIFQTGRCRLDNAEFLYIIAEYAEENLSQILLQRALTPEETRDMLDPVLDALLYLHGKGFVHGSIKPANIMAVDDKVKISNDEIRLVGAPRGDAADLSVYDPPELAAAGFSSAGDVWSLGMTLVEILTQHLPVWNSADQPEPQLLESVVASLPQPFLDIVHNSLLRDPVSRWTVGEIAARLQPNPQVHPSSVAVSRLPESPLPAAQVSAQRTSRQAKSRPAQPSRSSSPRYIIPAVAAGLILVAIVIPRFLNQRLGAKQSVSSESSSAQLKVPAPVKSRSKMNSQGAMSTPATSSKPAKSKSAGFNRSPLPTVLRTEEKAKPAAVNPERGEVLSQVLPNISSKARDTIRGTVKIAVRVHVSPAGSVTATQLEGPAPSKYFADLSLKAARGWTFQSPESGGRSVPSEWLLRFYFTPSSTKAIPEQAVP